MYNDTQNPDPYDAPYPTQPAQPTAPSVSYNLLGTDPNGQAVYQGTDGQMYTDGAGLNGFVAYNGPGVATHGDPIDPTAPPTAPPPAGGAPTPTPTPGPAPSPNVTPAQPTPPPAFKYDEFAPPDPNDLSNDKAFQFENAEGLRAIGARNAALGTLNTGGTLKEMVGFGQNLARARYNDLYDRSLRTYGTNRGNAVENYNTNYGTQYKDPWTEAMQRAQMDQNNNQFNSTQGFNEWLENYKRSTLDPFDQKYKTLSLL